MKYRIEDIRLYVRETPPGRMAFVLGKQSGTASRAKGLVNPIGYVHMVLGDESGRRSFGCAADRLSVRWLDKRPGRSKSVKLNDLTRLIARGREVYLQSPEFSSPFEKWRACHEPIVEAGRSDNQEDLTCAFASALFERALLDGVSRLAGKPLFQMVREERLGFRPERIHPELRGVNIPELIPPRPRTRFRIRHTVGLADPLVAADLPADQRVNDGLPETLAEYIHEDGLTAFKVKISGDRDRDLDRLERIWRILPQTSETLVTLDANESFEDLALFRAFVDSLAKRLPGLFQHVAYIEQPLRRRLTLDPRVEPAIRKINHLKPLLIDEADGTLDAFKRAHALGYDGTSVKNCKGVFKALCNLALAAHYRGGGGRGFLSAEDLQNMPIVPLHQDFVTLSILNLPHCERNGHHYNFGLSMVTAKEKESVGRLHTDLYVRRGDEWFLNIRDGHVGCGSLQVPGYGVAEEPDWPSMTDMHAWVRDKHPLASDS